MPVLDRFVSEFDDAMSTTATISLDNLWERLKGETLNQFAELDRQGLSADELERELLAFVEGLSPKFEEGIARGASTVAVNEGRDMAIRSERLLGTARFVVRSEIFDERTCGPCRNLDGEVFEIGTPEYEAFLPPAKCDGGQNCRGFYIPIAEAA